MTVRRVGPYTVAREIGAGAMGRVYLARSASGRAVAVKVVRPELAGDPGFRRRFRAEVAAARAVSGAFTAPVVDADPDGTQPWLATAYVPGPSLRAAIDAHGPMPEATLRVLGAGLAEALVAIHRAGLIHRDLKPSNILLAPDGPRVIDFGISRAAGATPLTADGQVVGSAGYMAPEQAAGRAVTPAADVFSLGAVVVHAATGRPPFGTGPFHVLMFRAAHEEPQLDGVPDDLRDVLAACLAKDPAGRPPADRLPGLLAPPPATGWLPEPIRDDLKHHEQTLDVEFSSPIFTRRRVLAITAVAGAAGAAALLKGNDDPFEPPRARWEADLPSPSMEISGATGTALYCLGHGDFAAVDLKSGKLLWDDSGTSAALDGHLLVTVKNDRFVYAVHATTGVELWRTKPSATSTPQIVRVTPGTVVLKISDGLLGLDATTGRTRWTHPTGFDARTATPTGLLILADPKGCYALDLRSGRTRWQARIAAAAAFAPRGSDVVYVLDTSMNLIALHDGTGARHWTRPSGLPAPGPVTYSDSTFDLRQGTLYIWSLNGGIGSDGAFAAFDPGTGHKHWQLRTRPYRSDHAVSNATTCYFDGTLVGIDTRTGKRVWKAEPDLAPLHVLGTTGTMFLAAHGDSGLHGLDTKTGRQIWHHPAEAAPGSSWSMHQSPDTLVTASAGHVTAFTLPT